MTPSEALKAYLDAPVLAKQWDMDAEQTADLIAEAAHQFDTAVYAMSINASHHLGPTGRPQRKRG